MFLDSDFIIIRGYNKFVKGDNPAVEEVEEAEKLNPVGPQFNADSAYAFTKAQCDFGYRVQRGGSCR